MVDGYQVDDPLISDEQSIDATGNDTGSPDRLKAFRLAGNFQFENIGLILNNFSREGFGVYRIISSPLHRRRALDPSQARDDPVR